MSETMHRGIFEGVHVSDVPVDYLMFVVKCSKEGSNNPNTLIAQEYLNLSGYNDCRKKAIDYKTRMILKEYEYEKKCLSTDTFYFNQEVKYNTHTKNGRINTRTIDNIKACSIDEDFNNSIGIQKQNGIYYIDLIKRIIKYGLKARTMTLNVAVSRNILSKLYGGDEYSLTDLDYQSIYNELSKPEYEKMMLLFYMQYKRQIENDVQYEF